MVFLHYSLANIAPELFTNNSSIKPVRSYWQTIAPTQAIYYDGDKIPQLKNKFLVGTFTGNIYALTIDTRSKQVIEEEKIALRHYPIRARHIHCSIAIWRYLLWWLPHIQIEVCRCK